MEYNLVMYGNGNIVFKVIFQIKISLYLFKMTKGVEYRWSINMLGTY